MKFMLLSFRLLLVMSAMTVLYTFLITVLAQNFFSEKANGSLIKNNGVIIGSALIAQKFEKSEYFWPRPSAIDFSPLPSGASNLGPTSLSLKKIVAERAARLKATHTEASFIPQDLLFTSGSGLDPHISPEAARYQAQRIATSRNKDIKEIEKLIERFTSSRQFGLLGQPRVNVLELNRALDQGT